MKSSVKTVSGGVCLGVRVCVFMCVCLSLVLCFVPRGRTNCGVNLHL